MIEFPLFRKFSNNTSFYKIHSEKSFTEIKTMGKYYFINEVNALQFPEMVLIKDMINLEVGEYIGISEIEYDLMVEKIKLDLEYKNW
jgi:hypothetical protein